MNEEIEQLRETFTKVITAKIVLTIKNHYGTLEAFKSACRDKSNKALSRYQENFHLDSKTLQALTRDKDGKRHLAEVLEGLDSKRLVHKGKYDKKFSSGKKFKKLSTFYVPFDELERLFSLEGTANTPFHTDSAFYTKEEHKLIDRYVFGFRKERKPYTKSAKFLQAVETRKNKRLLDAVKGDNLSDSQIDVLLDKIDFTD